VDIAHFVSNRENIGTSQLFRLHIVRRAAYADDRFGTAIGFVFAVLALSVSVVSFPMLLDRPIDAEAIDVEIEHPVVAPTIDVPIAIQTSIKAVLVNPFTMALWGLIVAGSLAIGFLLMFAGLAVVVPVLAHSAWHLYRKVVEPAASG